MPSFWIASWSDDWLRDEAAVPVGVVTDFEKNQREGRRERANRETR